MANEFWGDTFDFLNNVANPGHGQIGQLAQGGADAFGSLWDRLFPREPTDLTANSTSTLPDPKGGAPSTKPGGGLVVGPDGHVYITDATGKPISDLTASAGMTGGGSGSSGSGSGSAVTGPQPYFTPDGVEIAPGSAEDRYYQMADAVWTKVYGVHAPYAMVRTFRDLGVENTSQLDTIMQGMPSHILNPDGTHMSLGVYDNLKGVGNQFSDKYFGRPVSDALIQQWVKAGTTTPESVELWFLNHPAKDIPQDVYGQIYDQASAWTKQYYNDLPHPDQVNSIYQGMQVGP